jgi:PDDEXK-like domain of unknown function (DUF3799)
VNAEVESLSAELLDELATNSRRKVVDPRDVPCRFSTLKMFATGSSPLHYWHACQSEYEETLSMRLGSGAHAILFGQPVVTFTGAVRRGRAWDEFKAANTNCTILNQSERRQADAIASAINNNALACTILFDDTQVEKRIDWSWDGRAFRSTPDVLGVHHIADLKCLKSADPERVMWQSRNMHYAAQAALYRRAVLEKHSRKVRDCFLVVVENKQPHPVSVLRFTERALDLGDRSCLAWNERRRLHEDSNTYPGYVQTIVDLDVPDETSIDDLGLTFAAEEDAA